VQLLTDGLALAAVAGAFGYRAGSLHGRAPLQRPAGLIRVRKGDRGGGRSKLVSAVSRHLCLARRLNIRRAMDRETITRARWLYDATALK
jgi:hypothetical protein